MYVVDSQPSRSVKRNRDAAVVDIVNEKPIRLKALALHLGVSYKTVWAWSKQKGRRLRVTRLNGSLFTTWRELERFQDHIDEQEGEYIPEPHRQDRAMQEQIRRERESLRAKHGI